MIVRGSVSVPGDKSITHRVLTLAALAPGTSQIEGALTSRDARSSAAALRRLGAEISPLRSGRSLRVKGRRRFHMPTEALYCGNSGTTARLLLGHSSAVTSEIYAEKDLVKARQVMDEVG